MELSFLKTMKPVDCLFLDPARRDSNGGKTVLIADCEPDVCALEDLLVERAHTVMIKLSPMLDMASALNELKYVSEIHIVAVNNECKELIIIAFIGPKIEVDWEKQDTPMVSRRILITQPKMNGKQLGEFHFSSMYGVNVTRVNRSGMDIFASRNLTLQVGDRVMVVGPQDAVERVANLMGNSLKRLDHPNIVTIFVGIFLGIFFGSLPIAFPGIPTPVKLGLAGGPLIVSILIGRFGYKLKLVTYTTMSANLMLREIGIALFLASVGIKAGANFVNTVVDGDGLLYVGEQGVPALVFNESTRLVEPQEIEYTGMSIGKKYHLFITCNFADDYSKQSFQEEVYEIVESTKPDVELTVVGNVEPDQPYKVSYTIKAPNGDCRGIRYVENSMAEWNASLRPEYGMDEKFYVTNYGLDVTDADVIQAINSSEGYKMYFNSYAEEENMLVVQAYNEDEDLSEPYMAKATAVADFGTPVDADGQAIMDNLCGTWNATFNRQGSNGETETITFPVEFSREPEEAGEYADYDKLVNTIMTMKNMTEEEAKLYIEEEKANYIQAREKQIDFYKMKNRIVGRFKGEFPHKYASPWDLFNNISYSAVDADDLFFDYGPKIFLEVIPVEENGQTLYAVILSANLYAVPPLSDWNTPFTYYIMGYDGSSAYHTDFPVKVDEDGNGLTIQAYEYNGMTLTPFFAGMYNNTIYNTYYGSGDIVLTRNNASAMKTLKSSVTSLKTTTKNMLTTPWAAYQTATIKNMPKTFLPSADVARKLKRESVTIDCSKSSFIKKIQK